MMNANEPESILIVGAGFTGLTAALSLAERGHHVTVLESDSAVGGLAGSFTTSSGYELEKFYHHWFSNDHHVTELIDALGLSEKVQTRYTRTGNYYANNIYRLSTPLDLLRYAPLSFFNRIRLGCLVPFAHAVRDWRKLENYTAAQWLERICGRQVYQRVWEPLLYGKFGPYAEEVSAVWFWKKIVLRGGSRGKGGKEQLLYFSGGFSALAKAMCQKLETLGGRILCDQKVAQVLAEDGCVTGVRTIAGDCYEAYTVLFTGAAPEFLEIAGECLTESEQGRLEKIRYLGNTCLTLELDRSLSDTYWMNVNDPEFPFVGVIEHTNFEPASSYGGNKIIYLSKYLQVSDALFAKDADEFFDYAKPYLVRMFPQFDESWVKAKSLYRARYSQPIVTKSYGEIIPPINYSTRGLYLSTMAQIYPEDRGTNYAIREGKKVADLIASALA